MMDNPFLQEICADPDDITTRLVYADWLEERGDPLADLIRVQCELEFERDVENAAELQEKESELLAQYKEEWLLPLESLGFRDIQIRRGLVEEARIEASHFIAHADKIVQRLPPTCRLNLRKSKGHLKTLASVDGLKQIHFLSIRVNRLDDADIQDLLGSPYLGQLRELDVSGNNLTEDAAARVASAEMANLRSLSLNANPIGDAGIDALLGRVS